MRRILLFTLAALLAAFTGCGESSTARREPVRQEPPAQVAAAGAPQRGVSLYPLSAPPSGASQQGQYYSDSGPYSGAGTAMADPPMGVDNAYQGSSGGTYTTQTYSPGQPYSAPVQSDASRRPSPYDALFTSSAMRSSPSTTYYPPVQTVTTTYTESAAPVVYSDPIPVTYSEPATATYSTSTVTTTYTAPTTTTYTAPVAATTYSAPVTTTVYTPQTTTNYTRGYYTQGYAEAGYDVSRISGSPYAEPVITTRTYPQLSTASTTYAPVATGYQTTTMSTVPGSSIGYQPAGYTGPTPGTAYQSSTSYTYATTPVVYSDPAPVFAAPVSTPVYAQPYNPSPAPMSVSAPIAPAAGEYRLVPALDIPPGNHPNDAGPSQWFEIVRPGNGPIRIGRVSATCVCVGVRVPNRTVAAGERALIEARTITRPPVNNLTYGMYVSVVAPVSVMLDSDVTIRF